MQSILQKNSIVEEIRLNNKKKYTNNATKPEIKIFKYIFLINDLYRKTNEFEKY